MYLVVLRCRIFREVVGLVMQIPSCFSSNNSYNKTYALQELELYKKKHPQPMSSYLDSSISSPKISKLSLVGGILFVMTCFTLSLIYSVTSSRKHSSNLVSSSPPSHHHPHTYEEASSYINGNTLKTFQDSTEDDENASLPSLPPLLFYSSYQCNKYQEGIGHSVPDIYPKHTLFAQCSFQNLCLNRRGEWILFLDNATAPTPQWISSVNEKVWVYTQPRMHSSRGDMIIRVYGEGPVQLVSTLSSFNEIRDELQNTQDKKIVFKVAQDFKYISKPTFLTHRYVAGNVGHLLMDGMTEAMINMVMFKLEEFTEMNMVFLEDLQDDLYHKENWVGAYNYDKNVSDKYSIDFFGLMTRQPILQKCSTLKGWTIAKAPCRNQSPHFDSMKDGDELQVCFKNAIAGMSRPYLLSVIGAEVINEPLRKLVSKVTKINFEYEASIKEEIVVAIHNKPKQGRHGEIIWNVEEIYSILSENLPKEEFIVKTLKKKVRVINLHLEKLNAREQVHLFSQVDVYIVDQGSASYMTMFLPRNSIVIQSPDCRYREDHSKFCYDRFSQYAYTFSHVK